jgi:uncharacterized membrane protein YbhN (UPF0104 family)
MSVDRKFTGAVVEGDRAAAGDRAAEATLVQPSRLPQGGFIANFILSLAIGFGILSLLIAYAGPWDLVAMTRLLDLLIAGGIVQYHDLGAGFIAGIPDPKHYYMSQDPISWRMVFIAAVFITLYPMLKAVQFDRIARIYGSKGSVGDHMRAYFYGDGLDRFLPFNFGRVGTAVALAKSGRLSAERAGGAVFISQIFTVFEICSFALVGLFLLGWMAWLSQIFWSLLFLMTAYFLISRQARMSVVPPAQLALQMASSAAFMMGRSRPGLLVQLCVLSLLAFGSLDIATYFVMNAFHSTAVLIQVEPSVLLMGIVGGYIAARLVPITPGGIGVWELGFATGLHLGGSDVSLALVGIAILTNVLRIVTSLLVMAFVVLRYEMPTNLGEVTRVFLGAPFGTPAVADTIQDNQAIRDKQADPVVVA